MICFKKVRLIDNIFVNKTTINKLQKYATEICRHKDEEKKP
jgi:hypothetical protein